MRDPLCLLLILTAQFTDTQPFTSLPPSAAILKLVTDKKHWHGGALMVPKWCSENACCHMPIMGGRLLALIHKKLVLSTVLDFHMGITYFSSESTNSNSRKSRNTCVHFACLHCYTYYPISSLLLVTLKQHLMLYRAKFNLILLGETCKIFTL